MSIRSLKILSLLARSSTPRVSLVTQSRLKWTIFQQSQTPKKQSSSSINWLIPSQPKWVLRRPRCSKTSTWGPLDTWCRINLLARESKSSETKINSCPITSRSASTTLSGIGVMCQEPWTPTLRTAFKSFWKHSTSTTLKRERRTSRPK